MRKYSAYSPSPRERRGASRYNRDGDCFIEEPKPKPTPRQRIVKGVKGLTPTNIKSKSRGFEREPRPTTPAKGKGGGGISENYETGPDENDAGNRRSAARPSNSSSPGAKNAKSSLLKQQKKLRQKLRVHSDETSEISFKSSSESDDLSESCSSSDESDHGTEHHRRRRSSLRRQHQQEPASELGSLASQFIDLVKISMSQGCASEEVDSLKKKRRSSSRKHRSSKGTKRREVKESSYEESSASGTDEDDDEEAQIQKAKDNIKKKSKQQKAQKKKQHMQAEAKNGGRSSKRNQLRVTTMHTEISEDEEDHHNDEAHHDGYRQRNPHYKAEAQRNVTPHYKATSPPAFEDELAEFDYAPPARGGSDRYHTHHQDPLVDARYHHEDVPAAARGGDGYHHRQPNHRFQGGMRVPDVPEVFDDGTIESRPTHEDGYTVAFESIPGSKKGRKSLFGRSPRMPLVEHDSHSEHFFMGRSSNKSYGSMQQHSLPDMPDNRGMNRHINPVQRHRYGRLEEFGRTEDHSSRRIQFLPIPPGKIDFVLIDTPSGPKVSWAGFASNVQAGDYVVGIEGRDTRALTAAVTTKLLNDKKRKSRVVTIRRTESGEV